MGAYYNGDVSWGDMPEELATQLYDLLNSLPGFNQEQQIVEDLKEWLGDNINSCSWPVDECGEKPVPGTDRCPEHHVEGKPSG